MVNGWSFSAAALHSISAQSAVLEPVCKFRFRQTILEMVSQILSICHFELINVKIDLMFAKSCHVCNLKKRRRAGSSDTDERREAEEKANQAYV